MSVPLLCDGLQHRKLYATLGITEQNGLYGSIPLPNNTSVGV